MKSLITILALTCLNPAVSHAQDQTGNGGGTWATMSKEGAEKIINYWMMPEITVDRGNEQFFSYEIYDLFEGRERLQLKGTLPTGTDANEIVRKVVAEVNLTHPGLAPRLKAALREVKKRFSLTSVPLNKRKDFSIPFLETREQHYTQLANWDDFSGNLLVYSPVFMRLDALNVAALYFHEAAYLLDRIYMSAEKSDDARKFTAEAFYHAPLSSFLPDLKTLSPSLIHSNLAFVSTPAGDSFGVRTVTINWKSANCYDYSDLKNLVKIEKFSYASAGEIKIKNPLCGEEVSIHKDSPLWDRIGNPSSTSSKEEVDELLRAIW